ncbi:ABC transporter permease [Actinomadura algeriensis]|uniref:Transport permease protein n=1 Tax=Actinomadura algeriensis TaxID=1679523 RepID=A0ABR9JJ05_9ACTN|nr:ABC transporter permease [Actinomadura algeriensis]MBE1530403.1 ABC-2 type transport system permease protein [Actinomadura algeriensis]
MSTAPRIDDVSSPEVIGAVLSRAERPPRPGPWSASLTFGWRAMLKIKHVPEQMLDVTALPVITTLMFTYLFGGALAGSATEYLQFLLPGTMVMTVIMTTMYTGLAVNTDIQKGVFDRFRCIPMWRPAPMVGYLLGDAFRYTMASLVILMVGLLLGFRPGGGPVGVLLGISVLVAFSFALSWVWTMFGLLLRSEKSVVAVSMLVMFPLTFLSNVLVSPATLPGGLRVFVDNNPVTHLVAVVRGLMDGDMGGGMGAELAWVVGWGAALIIVFGPLTMWLYNRK